jgi:uncharacterized repeat protein (TIGR01451 family)
VRISVRIPGIVAVLVSAIVLLAPAAPAAASPGADLSVTKTDSPDPVSAGSDITYSITLTNAGPDASTSISLSDATPANTTFVSFQAPAGWTATTPAVGGTGTVTATNPTLAFGASAGFTLVVNVSSATPIATIVTNTATVTSADDPNAANNSATATTTVGSGADLSVTKSDSPDPVVASGNLTYAILVQNAGPETATNASLSDAVPTNSTFVSLVAPAGWSCTSPPVGGTGSISCLNPSVLSGASAAFTLVVNVNAATPDGTTISNTASVSSSIADSNPSNDSATATTLVSIAGEVCTITGTNHSDVLNGTPGDDVICGGNGKDTINGGGGNDIIVGGNGKDVLNGNDGNDTILGKNGKDQVTGGLGLDVLNGGNGRDSLNAVDGAGGDILNGGLGKDECLTDAGDLASSCP